MKEVSAKPTKYLLNSFCFYMHTRFKMRMPCKKIFFSHEKFDRSLIILPSSLMQCSLLVLHDLQCNILPSEKCIHNK